MPHDALIAAHIGLPHEPVGVVLVERIEELTGEFDKRLRRWGTRNLYRVRQIERPEAGARLTDVAALVRDMTPADAKRATVLVNMTASGRPAVDLLSAHQLKPIPIVTNNSDGARRGRGSIHVPQKELITSLSILMAERRLQAPRDAPNAAALADQLREFRAKPKTKAATDIWAREDDTGELVMATALACWWGETRMSSLLKQPPPPRLPPEPEPPLTFDRAMQILRRNRVVRARI